MATFVITSDRFNFLGHHSPGMSLSFSLILIFAITGPKVSQTLPMRSISGSTFIMGPAANFDTRHHQHPNILHHHHSSQRPPNTSLRSVPGGPPTWAPSEGTNKDYSPAIYVSKFAKMYEKMRQAGRPVREAIVTARESLTLRGMGPWLWVNGATRRVDSPLEWASISSTPVFDEEDSLINKNSVVGNHDGPSQHRPSAAGLQSISYSTGGRTRVPSFDVFQAYSKFIDQNINYGALDARKAFGRQLSALGDTSISHSDPVSSSSAALSISNSNAAAAILRPDFSRLTQVQHNRHQQKSQIALQQAPILSRNDYSSRQKSTSSVTYDISQYRRQPSSSPSAAIRQYFVKKTKRSSESSSSEEAARNGVAVDIEPVGDKYGDAWSSIIMDRVHGA